MSAKIRIISDIHGPVTHTFLSQIREYRLLFTCEDCVFFDHQAKDCVHGYPNEPHRQAYFEHNAEGKVLIFCREFEPE